MKSYTHSLLYQGPKWKAKKAAFEANAKFKFIHDNWARLNRVSRAEAIAALLFEMGPHSCRFVGSLFDVTDKTISKDLAIAGLDPCWKKAITDGESAELVLKKARAAKSHGGGVPNPGAPPAATAAPIAAERQAQPDPVIRDSGAQRWVNPFLESRRVRNWYD